MKILAVVLLAAAAGQSARLPVSFEPNRGQYPATSDFMARGPGYALSLRPGRTDFVTRQAHITTVLAGASAASRGEGEAILPGVANYLHGSDRSRWITGVSTYNRVRYRAVYPGIDLLYYGAGDVLEYDFIVVPGADPRSIQMRFEGARRLRLDGAGDLLIETDTGALRQHRPAVYQEIAGVRRQVEAHYVLRGNTVRFALARYDRKLPLIIDPVLTWASFLGYSNSDTGEAVALDASGNIYVTGASITSYGDNDVLIAKIAPDGTTAAIKTYFGGSYDDVGHAIAVDTAGNIYITGQTDSPDFPISGAAIPSYYQPGYSWDVFLIKLNPTATTFVFSDFLGGSYNDIPTGLALDASNNSYVVGYTNSPDFPVTKGAAQTTLGGGQDGFVVAINAAGNGFTYSTFLGGSSDEYAYGIAVDSSGNAWITGSTGSTNFPVTSGALQSTNAGAVDAFVTKLSSAGAVSYSTYLGGNGNDYGFGLALDSTGIYISGETASINFPLQNPAQKTFAGGTGDAFVTKLDLTGKTILYSTYLGGTGEDSAYAVTVDGAGNAYLAGSTSSTDLPLSDPFQSANQGTYNALVAGLDAGGSLLFSSYLGGNGLPSATATAAGVDYANAIAVSCSAGLVVTGTTSSANFPVTSGAFANAYQGGASDAFVARLGINTAIPAISTGGVVNGASFASGPVAPGSLIAIYGTNLASATQQPTTTPLPNGLAGATVKINNVPAPIFFASAGQINVQVPYETTTGSAAVTVSSACGASIPISVQVTPAAPYLFPASNGDALAFNQDNTPNSAANPAKAGSAVTVYMTGIGAVSNPVATGVAASATTLSPAALSNSATIGGTAAGIYFIGLTPQTVAIAQANVIVPTLTPGKYPVVITVNGVPSNALNVYVK